MIDIPYILEDPDPNTTAKNNGHPFDAVTGKKIVHYYGSQYALVVVGQGAWITPVDHPDSTRVSNKRMIHTSEVVSYDPETGIFETLNTLYKPLTDGESNGEVQQGLRERSDLH